jgi:hypothetical protein
MAQTLGRRSATFEGGRHTHTPIEREYFNQVGESYEDIRPSTTVGHAASRKPLVDIGNVAN